MSCIGKIVLSVAILAVCLQAAPVAKLRRGLDKFFPAQCPEARTGKYLVVLEYPVDQPGSSEQKAAPSFVLKKYMDSHLVKEDNGVKEEQPTKADILNQVSATTDEPSTTPPTNPDDDGDNEKTAKVKSYSMLIAELMYHVDMNDPALQDVLRMSGVAFVEEEMSVFGANCGGFGNFGYQEEDNEPEPAEEEGSGSQGQGQPMMLLG